MKHFKFFSALLFSAALLGLSACGGDPVDPISDTYVRKQLIEQFTGQGCQYCPAGVSYIKEAISGHESEYIWVAHHDGYTTDNFSISENTSMVNYFGVSGAPSMMLNRTEGSAKDDKGNSVTELVYHPYYLNLNTSSVSAEAEASVHIDKTYDASSKQLSIKVYGTFKDASVSTSKLTVLIMESGLHGTQSDAETDAGWSDYIHNNVPRKYLTNYLGEEVTVTNNAYSKEYTLTLNDAWVADNCCIVAFLTETSNKPVINAEWAAVVDGTQGGRDIQGGGVTLTETGPGYGEETAVTTNNVTLNSAGYYVDTTYNNVKIMGIQAMSSTTVSGGYPLVLAYVMVDADSVGIPEGTYPISNIFAVGNAMQGSYMSGYGINGSVYIIANATYLQYGYLVPDYLWYLYDGSITISSTGMTINATSYNGSTVTATFTGTMTDYDASSSAANAPRKMQSKAAKSIGICTLK